MWTGILLLAILVILYTMLYLSASDIVKDIKRRGDGMFTLRFGLLMMSAMFSFVIMLMIAYSNILPHTVDTTYKHVDGRVYKVNQLTNLFGEGKFLVPTTNDGRLVVKVDNKYKYTGDAQ